MEKMQDIEYLTTKYINKHYKNILFVKAENYEEDKMQVAALKQVFSDAMRAYKDYKRSCKTHKIHEFIQPLDFLTSTIEDPNND